HETVVWLRFAEPPLSLPIGEASAEGVARSAQQPRMVTRRLIHRSYRPGAAAALGWRRGRADHPGAGGSGARAGGRRGSARARFAAACVSQRVAGTGGARERRGGGGSGRRGAREHAAWAEHQDTTGLPRTSPAATRA